MLSHPSSNTGIDGGRGTVRVRGTVQTKLPWFVCGRSRADTDAPSNSALPAWDDERNFRHLLDEFCQHF